MVEVGDCVCLVADEVIEAVGAVGVDEAITDPLSSANGFVNVCNYFKGGLYAVLVDFAGA